MSKRSAWIWKSFTGSEEGGREGGKLVCCAKVGKVGKNERQGGRGRVVVVYGSTSINTVSSDSSKNSTTDWGSSCLSEL